MDPKQTRNLLKIHSLVSVVTTIKQGSQFRTGGHLGLAKKRILIPINTDVPFRVYCYFIIKLINTLYNLLKIVIKSNPNLFLTKSPSQINMFHFSQVLKLNTNIY